MRVLLVVLTSWLVSIPWSALTGAAAGAFGPVAVLARAAGASILVSTVALTVLWARRKHQGALQAALIVSGVFGAGLFAEALHHMGSI